MSPILHDFLKHILYECNYIINVIADKTYDDLTNDETLNKAIVRSLEIIGEATKKLPPDLMLKYPFVAWNEMAGMRDVLIHDYFGIDYDVVWNTIQNDIPELQKALLFIIEKEQ